MYFESKNQTNPILVDLSFKTIRNQFDSNLMSCNKNRNNDDFYR